MLVLKLPRLVSEKRFLICGIRCFSSSVMSKTIESCTQNAICDLYFFKKTTETFTVSDETHKTNSINASTVTYPTYKGQQQRYNVNAITNLQMNTGFIKEDATKTIEELFLSENVFIRFDSKTLPIIPRSKSFVHRTSLNDKLINYTVEFDFAFDKINNVR